MPTPGIYLTNASGETVPLATEDGKGDHALLAEALREGVDEGTIDADSLPGVHGDVDDAEYRLRQSLASGTIEGEDYDVSLNVDGGCVFVEFDDVRVAYDISDMVVDAYQAVIE